MAHRRMFSKDITENDSFLDMPLSTQALYFHLGMQADDDGFVSPNRIVRMLGCQPDDLRILVAKKFVIQFDDGIIVIKHWKINNYLRNDRYKETTHQDKLANLRIKSNGGYQWDTNGIPMVDAGKDSIGKVSKEYIVENPDAFRLVDLLIDWRQQVTDGREKKPNRDKWVVDIDKMIRLDKLDPEEIEYVINWSQQHHFWSVNIRSAKKLREQYSRLYTQIKNEKNGHQ